MNTNEQMDFYLKSLSLHRIRENYLPESEIAAKAKLSYQDYLYRLVEAETLSKIDRSINRRIQLSGFPMLRKFEEFDFSYQPKLDEKLLRELTNLNFMNEAKNIIFLGPPGVGKTHLAIALGLKACLQRKRVAFYSAENLTQLLAAHDTAGNLKSILESLARIELLIIDELGYIDLSKKTASLFFQLVAKRYEKSSIIITSNKPFEEWGQIFTDDVVASAIIDRLLHHCYPFFINGKSFRMKKFIEN
jgi:DNA replication protein DnaC